MTALLKEFDYIHDDIQMHPAWFGHITGLNAEKLLRGNLAFTYLLRSGETASDYYVTFTDETGTVRHQPFNITTSHDGWFYENGVARGPFAIVSIDEVLHAIMHCKKDECIAYSRKLNS